MSRIRLPNLVETKNQNLASRAHAFSGKHFAPAAEEWLRKWPKEKLPEPITVPNLSVNRRSSAVKCNK